MFGELIIRTIPFLRYFSTNQYHTGTQAWTMEA